MLGALAWATVGVALVVAGLGAALLVIYVQVHRQVPTGFTLGLAAFAAFFFAEGLFLAYACWEMLPLVEGSATPYFLGIAILEAGGLGAQLAVTDR